MSNVTIASLPRISRDELASRIRSSSGPGTLPSSLAIIDVRDSDHIGGHIRGSTWVPSSTLDYKMPELVRTLREKEVVVFHCALSQQRGPGAALRYARERLEKEGAKKEGEGEKRKEGEVEEKGKEREGEEKGKEQVVMVLTGGFTEWQEKYGSDEVLTEGWDKQLWEWGS